MISQSDLAAKFPDDAQLSPAGVKIPEVHQRNSLINGRCIAWTGDTKSVVSAVMLRQSTGELSPIEIGSHPMGGLVEAHEALDAAVAAFDNGRGVWPTMPVSGRIAAMQHFLQKMSAKRNEIVDLIMWEIGKSRPDSEKEFDRTVDYMRQTIEALRTLDNSSSRFEIVDSTIGQIRRTPLGVVLCMGPYNYPLNETFATLIPALIMGNTVVFKPPTFGILLFEPLLEAFRDAFPAGVINFVYGQGSIIVPALLESGKINVLTLIGSSRVADHLKKMHPKVNRLRAVLGLDAKNAAIVTQDADLDLAVKECLAGALSFNGQRCTALKMLIVHRSIIDRFLAAMTKEIANLKFGMPWDSAAQITPLPSLEKVRQMTELVADAVGKGAKILNPGGGESSGTLFFPALVYPVTAEMKLYREEQFGPVVPVMPFDDIQEALHYVATSEHGQQVSLFSQNADEVGRLVDPLVNQVCRVNINCQCQRGPDVFPFTGRKDSAEGTLSVTDALRAFSIRSMIAAKYSDSSRNLLNDIVDGHRSSFIHTGFIL